MKKWILPITLVTALIFCLTGCGNKSEIFISFDGIEDYELVEIPSDVVNLSHTDEGITVTVKKNGNYDFVLTDADGKEYSFTLKYQNKKAEIVTDSDVDISADIK